jgi:hypothetical protein
MEKAEETLEVDETPMKKKKTIAESFTVRVACDILSRGVYHHFLKLNLTQKIKW